MGWFHCRNQPKPLFFKHSIPPLTSSLYFKQVVLYKKKKINQKYDNIYQFHVFSGFNHSLASKEHQKEYYMQNIGKVLKSASKLCGSLPFTSYEQRTSQMTKSYCYHFFFLGLLLLQRIKDILLFNFDRADSNTVLLFQVWPKLRKNQGNKKKIKLNNLIHFNLKR